MRILKYHIWILAIIFCFVFIVPAFAEIKVFEKEESAVVGEDQSKNQVESMLQEKAKLAALEEAGTYIATLTVVQNYQLQKDEVTALAAGVLSTKRVGIPSFEIIDGGRNVKVKVKFRVEVDSSVLDKRIEAFMKDRGALKKEEDYIRKIRELEKQLTNLKSSELRRLEELNAQAIALERERDKQRLFREEQILKAKGEFSRAEAERLAKEREMRDRINRTLAEQERAKRKEVAALAAEQDRIKRAHLENEQRWNELSRKAKLSQDSWVVIDDSLSLKQAMAEVMDLRREIANLKKQLDYQYSDNTRNLKAAYFQQQALATSKLPPEPAAKDTFESTTEYNNRLAAYESQVKEVERENNAALRKLEKEENLRLAEAKVEYLEQQLRVLAPFIKRLQELQARKFTLPEGASMVVALGDPDADNNRFPLNLQHEGKSWLTYWNYNDRNSAKDFYRTRTYLKAEGLFQIEEPEQVHQTFMAASPSNPYYQFLPKEPEQVHPKLTTARVTHMGTKETREFGLEKQRIFTEIDEFDKFKKEETTAKETSKKAEKNPWAKKKKKK